MPLSERSRSALYLGLVEVVHDQEAVEELLSYFPARDVDEPVTREFLRAELAGVRGEFADLRAEVRTESAALRGEFADLRAEFADLRAEFAELRAEVRTDLSSFRVEMHAEIRRQTAWLMATMITLGGVLVAGGAIG